MTMKKTISLLTIMMISTLILSACMQILPTPVSTATPEPTKPVPTATVPGDSKTITLDDQGKTIHLAVGDSFLLKLGEDYTWDVQISDQSVVSRVKNIMVIRGAQGVYDALVIGTTTLTATGNPVCLQEQPPCGRPSILFSITIEVK
jgi:basic membrane lipoprotein Med (substrate-binding protein (PBP1-ABC) superfamily)